MARHDRLSIAVMGVAVIGAAAVLPLRAAIPAVESRPAPVAPHVPTTQPAASDRVRLLIEQLSDRRAERRDDAQKQLMAMGDVVRPAMVEATHSDDPETATRAADVLRAMPIDLPTDSPRVRQILLQRYQHQPAAQRVGAAVQLLSLTDNSGCEAVVRIVKDDPDPVVRWAIVRSMRSMDANRQSGPGNAALTARAAALAGKIDAKSTDPALLCLLGYAKLAASPNDSAAIEALIRAVESAGLVDDDSGEISRARDAAAQLLQNQHNYDALARLVRHDADDDTQATVAGVPYGVTTLFALHADYGPLAGYTQDLARFTRYLLRPPVLYAQGRIARRHGLSRIAAACDQLALLSGGDDAIAHKQTAEFCQPPYRTWINQAIAEVNAFIDTAPNDADADRALDLENAQVALGMLQAQRADHAASIAAYTRALDMLSTLQVPIVLRLNGEIVSGQPAVDGVKTSLLAEQFRQALDRGAAGDIAKCTAALVAADPADPEIAQDLIHHLDTTGDHATADRLFNPLLDTAEERVKSDPTANNHNSLAWFLARSGRSLDTALQNAQTAVDGEPDNPAYIDTLAEVYFQKGDAAKAVEIEQTGLQKDPDHPELEAQMKRFKAGLGTLKK